MKKNILCFVLLILAIPGTSQTKSDGSNTSTKNKINSTKKQIIQSPFYDTQALYYANYGYWVYLLPVNSTGLSSESSINGTGLSGNKTTLGNEDTFSSVPTETTNATTTHKKPGTASNPKDANSGKQKETKDTLKVLYKVIESLSGKILLDDTLIRNSDVIPYLEKKFYNVNKADTIIRSILSRNPGFEETVSKRMLDSAYDKNTYINELFKFKDDFIAKMKAEDFVLPGKLREIAIKDIGGASPFNATTIADGIAQFLIERATEEISVTFFAQMQAAMKAHKELELLFPNTYEYLKNIEAYNFVIALNSLKSAFEIDIKNILSNVSKITTLDKYKALLDQFPELTIIFIACDVAGSSLQGQKAANIIHSIYISSYVLEHQNNISSSMKLIGLLSYCLRDIRMGEENPESQTWITQDRITLMNNNIAFQLFIGLLSHNLPKELIFNSANSLTIDQTLLNSVKGKIMETKYLFNSFFESINKINDYVSGIEKLQVQKNGKNVIFVRKIKLFENITKEIIGLADESIDFIPSEQTAEALKTINNVKGFYLPAIEKTTDIIQKIEEKDYSAAMFDSYLLIDSVFTKFESKKNQLYEQAKKDTAISKKDRIILKEDRDNTRKIRALVLDYGLFISSVAVAKDAKEVKEAIKTFALPAGSSRVKKESDWNIAVNAYLGYYRGHISENNIKKSSGKAHQNTQGITAPIGVSLSHGLGKWGSLSIFCSIIDVGAVVSYRLVNDSTAITSFEWSQIISPGFSLVYGFPIISKSNLNIPLSFGIGYQWGGLLTKVDPTINEYETTRIPRFNLFIGVDIPITNFFSKKKYKPFILP